QAVRAPTTWASTSRMCGAPARTSSRTGSALASPTRDTAGYAFRMLRRPERNSALSLTSATRMSADALVGDIVLADEGPVVFGSDRTPSRRTKRCPHDQERMVEDFRGGRSMMRAK